MNVLILDLFRHLVIQILLIVVLLAKFVILESSVIAPVSIIATICKVVPRILVGIVHCNLVNLVLLVHLAISDLLIQDQTLHVLEQSVIVKFAQPIPTHVLLNMDNISILSLVHAELVKSIAQKL